ncbi:phage head-tail connector protein [Algimonas porphyrae]|uniref:Phage gp6-like head-tail connector protein n=1 Tax=Algimonas porphyrae TaxID=1128113 RepID=A0ABQ5UYT1_9PROT|nr:phage head-tail connector protein [Algimonas porphyrae]GLQ20356.1 hypothetical protein GCM10007854_13110 [Algimonas porphyrae]
METFTISDPVCEPILLADTKTFLRLDTDDHDSFLKYAIAEHRDALEKHLGIVMGNRHCGVEGYVDGEARLPHWPISQVESVKVDLEPDTAATIDMGARPCTISVKGTGVVTVRYTAGYGTCPSDIPAPLRQAMLLLVARAYERRCSAPAVMPLMVDALTMPYRVVS